jgi:TPR repeat protein
MEKHLLQAADRGDTEAQFNLGIIYGNGLDDSRYAVEGGRRMRVPWPGVRRRLSTRHGLEPEQYRDAGSCQPITRSPRQPIRIGSRPSCRRRLRKCLHPREAAGPQTATAPRRPPRNAHPTQQRAVDRFAKSLSTLGGDALIDTYHQAWEDHQDARAEGSDNLGRAGAESLAAKTAMKERLVDYQSRYKARYP